MSGGSVQVLQDLGDLQVLLVLGPVQRRLALLRRGGGVCGGGRGRPGGRGRGAGRRGEAAQRLRRDPPHTHTPAPPPHPYPTTPRPHICAIAHLVLEAGVGLRIEQRLDAERLAEVSRVVQRCVLALPRRGGGPTHTRVSGGGGRVGGGCLRRMRPPQPTPRPPPPQPRSLPCRRACEPGGRGPAAGSGGGSAARRRRGAAAPAGQRGQRRAASPRSLPNPTPLAATPQQGRGARCSGHSGRRPW